MMHKMIRFVSLAAIAGAVALAAVPAAQVIADDGDNRPGAIRGVVKDGDGAAVGEAHVSLNTRNGRHVARAMTNENGQFGWRQVRPGPYSVQAGKRDVGRGQARAIVEPGEVTDVEITLRRR